MDHKHRKGNPAYAGMRRSPHACRRCGIPASAPDYSAGASRLFSSGILAAADEPAPRQPIEEQRDEGDSCALCPGSRARGRSELLLLCTAVGVWQPPPAAQEAVGTEAEEEEVAAAEAEGLAEGAFVLDTLEVTAAPGTTTEDTGSWTTEWMRSATGLPLSQKRDAAVDQRHHRRPDEGPQHHLGQRGDGRGHRHHRAALRQRADELLLARLPDRLLPVRRRADPARRHLAVRRQQHRHGALRPRRDRARRHRPDAGRRRARRLDQLHPQAPDELPAPRDRRRRSPTRSAAASRPTSPGRSTRAARCAAASSAPSTPRGHARRLLQGRATSATARSSSTSPTGRCSTSASATRRPTPTTSTWGGLPPVRTAPATLIDWPWGFNLGADWTYIDTQRTEAFASVEHVFENGWTGAASSRRTSRTSSQSQLAWISPRDARTTRRPGSASSSWAGEVRRRLHPGLAERGAERRLPGARPVPRSSCVGVFVSKGERHLRRLRRRPRARWARSATSSTGTAASPSPTSPTRRPRSATPRPPRSASTAPRSSTRPTRSRCIAGARRQLVGRQRQTDPGSPTFSYSFEGDRHALRRLHLRHQRDLDRLRQRHQHLQAAAGAGHRPQLSRPDLRLELRARRQGRACSTARSTPRRRCSRPTRRTMRTTSASSRRRTAASGPDGRWRVLGESSVVIYDARRAHVTEGKKPLLGATGLRVSVLPAGAVFDPRTGGGDL